MFVDASAMVAILMREPGFERVADTLRGNPRPLTSGIAVYEAALAIARKKASLKEAETVVWAFIALSRIAIVPVSENETRAALQVFGLYGKGRGHPAQLNLGDCFAYACAKTRDVPLLFVGNDFSRTDIKPAMS